MFAKNGLLNIAGAFSHCFSHESPMVVKRKQVVSVWEAGGVVKIGEKVTFIKQTGSALETLTINTAWNYAEFIHLSEKYNI